MDAAPTVVTDPATEIQSTSFVANLTVSGGGNVTDVTERGFAWIIGSSGTPETSDNNEFETGNFGNDFSWGTVINSLTPNTDYRVRGYAINSVGTTYGNTITVTTLAAAVSEERDISSSGSGGISEVSTIAEGYRSTVSEGSLGSSAVFAEGGANRAISSQGVGGISSADRVAIGNREAVSEGLPGESSITTTFGSGRQVSSEGVSGFSSATRFSAGERQVSTSGLAGISEVSATLSISNREVSSTGLPGESSIRAGASGIANVSSTGSEGISEVSVLKLGNREIASTGLAGISTAVGFEFFEDRDITVSYGEPNSYLVVFSGPQSLNHKISEGFVEPLALAEKTRVFISEPMLDRV
jgi:hypothetical protein